MVWNAFKLRNRDDGWRDHIILFIVQPATATVRYDLILVVCVLKFNFNSLFFRSLWNSLCLRIQCEHDGEKILDYVLQKINTTMQMIAEKSTCISVSSMKSQQSYQKVMQRMHTKKQTYFVWWWSMRIKKLRFFYFLLINTKTCDVANHANTQRIGGAKKKWKRKKIKQK